MANLGAATLQTPPTPSQVTAYNLAGTVAPTPPGPVVPTTGQIWPRGNPS